MAARTVLGRLWNRLADRYDRDDSADCCGSGIEALTTDSEESMSDSHCK